MRGVAIDHAATLIAMAAKAHRKAKRLLSAWGGGVGPWSVSAPGR
jgi:hypothetical protein